MIGTRTFTVPTESKLLCIISAVLTLGTLTLIALSLAALVAVAYLINLAMTVLVSLSIHIASLYNSSDPALKLFMLCAAGYLLIKLFHVVKRSLLNR